MFKQTLFILETGKHVLRQTVKTQMKLKSAFHQAKIKQSAGTEY